MANSQNLFKNISRPWLIVMALIIVYLGMITFRSYLKIRQLKAKMTELMGELSKQQTLNRELQKKLVELEDEKQLERKAREKLGLVKKGEVVFKIIEKPKK